MNRIDVILQGEAAAAVPLRSQSPRALPRAAKVLLPVWGHRFVRQFLELGLPTLLAPGNVPAVAASLPTEFVILTSSDDAPLIQETVTFKRLAAICSAKIHPIDHLITDSNHSTTITLAYTEAIRAAGEAMVDTCFFFLVSDYIMADGSLGNVLQRMRRGVSAVVVGNLQVATEDALPSLRLKLATSKDALVVPPRELMQWALNHLHPALVANTVNIPFSHNAHTNRLFWRIDGRTILGRFYLMHMLCVRPEITDFIIGASCDYSFVPEMCPSGNIEAVTDSDEYLVIEMQPRNHEAAFLRPGPLQPRALAKSLSDWTTQTHRDNARHSMVFHAAELPENLASSIKIADKYVADVAGFLRREPLPYRGHPFWRGAMAAYCDATGRKLTDDEWRYVLELPVSGDWMTHWLIWQAKYTLMGRPPRVLPWHPLWPDYHAVLNEIADFFKDPARRLLILSNEPNAYSTALADSGERVNRFLCEPFLRNLPERYKPMHGRFDLCLVQLSEGEMARGRELVDRIMPLMKDGGRIIIVVMNRRDTRNAQGFSSSVIYHGTQFMRPGALPTDIRFIAANRLRWTAYRGMYILRYHTNRHPLRGVPAAVAGGALLAVMSLIGNIDAFRRSSTLAPRGLASSFIMRLGVDKKHFDSSRAIFSRRSGWPRSAGEPGAAPLPLAGDQTREPQYNRCVELRDAIGLTPLGLMTNQVWYDDPRRLGFLLARYKFVAKMLSGRHSAAEVGCGDAFGARVVLQEVSEVAVYDFDPVFIDDVRARQDERWPLSADVHDIIDGPLPRRYDGVYSLDVIEHISRDDEDAYLTNLRASLTENGVLIIGTPSAESQEHASPLSKAGHINCKTGRELKLLLESYFSRVFLFSMNDEVVHTGFYPMAHYLFAVCTASK